MPLELHSLCGPHSDDASVDFALIGLLLILAFLQSASRVALINRQRGDWLARRVGWLVYTTLGRLARKQQKYENVQDVLVWVLLLYILLVIIMWFGLVLAGFAA